MQTIYISCTNGQWLDITTTYNIVEGYGTFDNNKVYFKHANTSLTSTGSGKKIILINETNGTQIEPYWNDLGCVVSWIIMFDKAVSLCLSRCDSFSNIKIHHFIQAIKNGTSYTWSGVDKHTFLIDKNNKIVGLEQDFKSVKFDPNNQDHINYIINHTKPTSTN